MPRLSKPCSGWDQRGKLQVLDKGNMANKAAHIQNPCKYFGKSAAFKNRNYTQRYSVVLVLIGILKRTPNCVFVWGNSVSPFLKIAGVSEASFSHQHYFAESSERVKNKNRPNIGVYFHTGQYGKNKNPAIRCTQSPDFKMLHIFTYADRDAQSVRDI